MPPQCGGKLEFDVETQKLTCPFCDYSSETLTEATKDQSSEDVKEKLERLLKAIGSA